MPSSSTGCDGMSSRSESVVLRRKSWVMAMPMEAKAREVRSHARKVRSVSRNPSQHRYHFIGRITYQWL